MRKERPHSQPGTRPEGGGQPSIAIPEGDVLELLKDSDLGDPLSEVTRAERKSLLGTSLLALAVTVGNLIPTNIDALGVKVEGAEQAGLLLILVLVQLYFFLAFVFYGLSDLNSWRLRTKLYAKKLRSIFGPLSKSLPKFDEASPAEWDRLAKLGSLKEETDLAKELMLADKARVVFEFGVPVLFGLSSLLIALDAFEEKASLGPWSDVLSLPLSLAPVLLLSAGLGAIWWRWQRAKSKPARSARRTSEHLARLTQKMREAGKLAPDDPARKALMDQISEELRSIGTPRKDTGK